MMKYKLVIEEHKHLPCLKTITLVDIDKHYTINWHIVSVKKVTVNSAIEIIRKIEKIKRASKKDDVVDSTVDSSLCRIEKILSKQQVEYLMKNEEISKAFIILEYQEKFDNMLRHYSYLDLD